MGTVYKSSISNKNFLYFSEIICLSQEPGIANKSYQPFRQLFRPSSPVYFTLTTKHSIYISVITRTYIYKQRVVDTRPVNRLRFCHLTLDVTISSFNAVLWIRIWNLLAKSYPDTEYLRRIRICPF